MNKYLKFSILFLLMITGFYLVDAFIHWEFNPGKWSVGGRSVVGIMGFVLSFFISAMVTDFSE